MHGSAMIYAIGYLLIFPLLSLTPRFLYGDRLLRLLRGPAFHAQRPKGIWTLVLIICFATFPFRPAARAFVRVSAERTHSRTVIPNKDAYLRGVRADPRDKITRLTAFDPYTLGKAASTARLPGGPWRRAADTLGKPRMSPPVSA